MRALTALANFAGHLTASHLRPCAARLTRAAVASAQTDPLRRPTDHVPLLLAREGNIDGARLRLVLALGRQPPQHSLQDATIAVVADVDGAVETRDGLELFG